MPMTGFDPKFADFPDYILGITHEIWEERGVETLRHYYAPDIPVRTPTSVVVGNEAVIDATYATLHEFPDRQLLGEDVIWCGDPESVLLSSHRIMSIATHAGDGVYGSATGTKLRYRVIGDCAARGNQIFDEWLVRDQGAIVRQLGLDPRRYAADRIVAEGGPEAAALPFTPAIDVAPRYVGTGNDSPPGVEYAELLTTMLEGDCSGVRSTYDRAVQLEMPGGLTGHSWPDVETFWQSVATAFPDAVVTVGHRIGRTDPGLSPRAAVRWSLDGIHGGEGLFGPPTGAPVHVFGISHAEFGPRGLRREWVLFDETAIWKQILLHTG